ncbi:MAG: Gfo/Idh/MocA family oxidoreductase, partial [Acetobacter malorum]
MDKTLRVGVIGAGHFGRYHTLKVKARPRATLVGLFDPDAKRAG